jgi:hypothetical protein
LEDKDLRCICGHTKHVHIGWGGDSTGCNFAFLEDVQEPWERYCLCQEFKLDNLKLIEDLAKERKLI